MKEEKIIRLVAIMLLILKKVKQPSKGKVEEDFQKAFEKVLESYGIEYLPKVHTDALCPNDDKQMPEDWEIDIVLNIKNFYIPIELKYRQEDQCVSGYDERYRHDIKKIAELTKKYTDIPVGYAIIVTSNNDLIENCNTLMPEYTNDWVELDNKYKALVVMKYNKTQEEEYFFYDYIAAQITKDIDFE